jgi:hypothetical protein
MGWLVLLLVLLAIGFGFWAFVGAAVLAVKVLFWVFIALLILSLIGWATPWGGYRAGPPAP